MTLTSAYKSGMAGSTEIPMLIAGEQRDLWLRGNYYGLYEVRLGIESTTIYRDPGKS